MAWREQLRPASFRGVAFKVDSHVHEAGRRTEVHQYAQRDEPFAEDMGRALRRWRVQAFVIGPDYMAARDALKAALETKGPGVLVHPWLGVLTVSVEGPQSIEESAAEGGQALFNLSFVESGANLSPGIAQDTAAQAADAAGAASTASADSLGAGFSVAGAPGFVAASAGDVLAGVQAQVTAAVSSLAPAISALGDLNQLGADLVSQAGALIAAPASMAGQVIALVGQVRALATNPLAALPGLRALMGFGGTLAVVLGDTPSRGRQRANQAALVNLVRRAAAAEAVIAVSQIDFESYDQAAQIRDQLAAGIDLLSIEAGDAGEDEAWRALEAMRSALVRDVEARGGSRARVFGFSPMATLPALVLAHRIYGDATRDLELVSRNRIAHPGFVPAGRQLELLTPDGGAG
ncbi:MAG: hypothetical protein GC145_18545 [Caulobacter sp.]|nr:hypothetical protein [Caulobacter sp.]